MELPLGIFEEITGMGLLPPPVDQADHDRRKNQRAPFGFRGIITYGKKGGEEVSSVVMVRDISVGGLSFLNEDTLKPGTLFVMEFKGHEDRPVQIRCSVQRCATGGLEETEHIVGATFEELLTEELPRPAAEVKPAEPPPETLGAVLDGAAPDANADAANEEVAAEVIAGEDLGEEEQKKPEEEKPAEKAADDKAVTASAPAPPAASPAPVAPAAAPAAAAKTPVAKPAAAPAAKGGLFVGGAVPKPRKTADDFPSEDEVGRPAAAAKPAPVEEAGPVFRVVPLPDPAPEPAKPKASSESHDSMETSSGDDSHSSSFGSAVEAANFPVGGAGKTHEVLARVKGLLLKQEQAIKKQQEQLREQKDNASKELQLLRAEVMEMKKQIAELRSRTQADDQAISDLASFLEQHSTDDSESSDRAESEAA